MNNSKDRFNAVPVIVQQIASSMTAADTLPHVRANQAQMVRTIRDYCDLALTDYEKKAAWVEPSKKR